MVNYTKKKTQEKTKQNEKQKIKNNFVKLIKSKIFDKIDKYVWNWNEIKRVERVTNLYLDVAFYMREGFR